MKFYLGYTIITPEMGSEGIGRYDQFGIYKGNTPEEVARDYCEKFGYTFKGTDVISESDSVICYCDYFNTYFIPLPTNEIVGVPNKIIGLKYKE